MSCGAICLASTLPSSTPHWSKESIPHTVPCVNTECSYSATNEPRRNGVRTSARITLVGRLPSITLCGTTASGVPSARTSSAVLPKASALACANTFAESRSWCSPSGLRVLPKPIRSTGMIVVPWWMSW